MLLGGFRDSGSWKPLQRSPKLNTRLCRLEWCVYPVWISVPLIIHICASISFNVLLSTGRLYDDEMLNECEMNVYTILSTLEICRSMKRWGIRSLNVVNYFTLHAIVMKLTVLMLNKPLSECNYSWWIWVIVQAPYFNIKIPYFGYKKSRFEYRKALRPFYLHSGTTIDVWIQWFSKSARRLVVCSLRYTHINTYIYIYIYIYMRLSLLI